MNLTLKSVLAFSDPRDNYLIENGKVNEDSFIAPVLKNNGLLFCVADGIGSYQGAKEASTFVCNYLETNSYINHSYLENSFKHDLKENFIQFIKELDSLYKKSSTTLSLCFLDDMGLSVWHIGDCRVYIKNANKLIQITNDHTQYQRLLDDKIYTKAELNEKNVSKSTLTNAVSPFIELNNDYVFIPSNTLVSEYGTDISILVMSDGAYHFWDKRKSFSKKTMSDIVKFGNALKRRIENSGAIDDYTLVGATFGLNIDH